MTEPALRCPGCGAPADDDAARCEYCRAALATVTCAGCFAAMFVGSRFCARCGAGAAREAQADDTPLGCPRCREAMQSLKLGATSVRECSGCGGLWLDPDSLQRLSDASEERSAVASALVTRVAPSAVPADVVRYIPCPHCAKPMNRVNFAGSSGVVLDLCKPHGVWLDRGELHRVLGFVERGGLRVAQSRERERLVNERQRLSLVEREVRQPMPLSPGGVGAFASLERDRGGDSLQRFSAHLIVEALGFIAKLVLTMARLR